MNRKHFTAAAFAVVASALLSDRAAASGGFEADDGTPVPTEIRVLVAADRAGRMPSADDATSFAFDGKRYRGVASIAYIGGREALIAHVGLDAYLAGVVPLEASAGWPRAALEAQAIVARTFVLDRRTQSRAYDVVAGDRDQLYGGIAIEAPAVTAAVDATSGRILASNGAPASVFFSACCGGHTANNADVWGGFPLPYLAGVACPHCTKAPDYRWTDRVPLERVQVALGAKLDGLVIADMHVGSRDASGRARTFTFADRARNVDLPAGDVRARIGASVLKSTLVTATAVENMQAASVVRIEGGGRGHGVGLCQWGARSMATDGASASDILTFYFPGTTVTRG
jgi:stage II sporulation protein D